MANGITYTIDFAAAIARLEEGTVRGSQAVKKMADEMEAASSFAKNALATIGLSLSGAAFTAAIKSAADAADAAAKMGDRFGIATETIIGMQHAATLAGVSNDGLTTALRGLAKSGIEAAQGNEQARMAFQRLGVQASEFIKLPMDKQLSVVIDRLGGMENAAVRNATAQQLMGRQAGEVMGLVADGSAAFRQAQEDTEAWGLSLNRVDAAKIEIANDALKRAEAAAKGLFTQISLTLSPSIVAIANEFSNAAKETHGFKDEMSFLDDALKAAASLAIAANDIFYGLGHQIGAVGAAVAALLSGEFKAAYNIVTEANADVLQHTIETNAAIDRIWKATSTSIDAEAKKMAESRAKFMKEGGDPGIVQFDSYTAALAQHLGAVIEGNKKELELNQEKYDHNQALLDEAAQRGIITDDFWQGQSMLLYAQYQDNLTKIQDEALKKRYGISQVYHQLDLVSASSFFGALGAMMVSHNRAAFEIGKAAAISQAIIDTYRAAQGAYAAMAGIPIVGPALGVAAAAAAIVVGLARVQQIRATQFGGGSVSGGATGTFSANPTTGVPTAPISPLTSQGTSQASHIEVNVSVINQGGVMIGDDGIKQLVLEQVVPVVSNAMNNDSLVLFNQNSRQSQNLVPA
jgi:hypothetical protein